MASNTRISIFNAVSVFNVDRTEYLINVVGAVT